MPHEQVLADKWIKSRLDDLQSESFEYATQNRMFMEDLGELLREMQSDIQSLRSERQESAAHMTEIKNLSDRLDQISKQMNTAKKIIRDENGMITAVRPMLEQEFNQKEGDYKK